MHGRTETLEKELGWGLLRADDGREVFFEKDSLVQGDWSGLEKGERLRFHEREGEKGPYATGITPAR
nr:cold shock domain-containing protein [Tranquillimonas alkanivorans]